MAAGFILTQGHSRNPLLAMEVEVLPGHYPEDGESRLRQGKAEGDRVRDRRRRRTLVRKSIACGRAGRGVGDRHGVEVWRARGSLFRSGLGRKRAIHGRKDRSRRAKAARGSRVMGQGWQGRPELRAVDGMQPAPASHSDIITAAANL